MNFLPHKQSHKGKKGGDVMALLCIFDRSPKYRCSLLALVKNRDNMKI